MLPSQSFRFKTIVPKLNSKVEKRDMMNYIIKSSFISGGVVVKYNIKCILFNSVNILLLITFLLTTDSYLLQLIIGSM